jgi:acyl-CoA reductase-like NAD-dependent aldehyde dehydrogenase
MTASTALQSYQLLIDGQMVNAASGETFETVSPATNQPIARVAKAGLEDVDRAVAAARRAFDDGRWSRMAPVERSRRMRKAADLIRERVNELSRLETLNSGKIIVEARADVLNTAACLDYYASLTGQAWGETIPMNAPLLDYTVREPIGVCAQIIPWNFPLMMASWKIAPALAAGCTVVLKPAEQTPLTSLRLGELALEAGIPAGVVNVVPGDGSTGAALVEHPRIDKISFTGSTAVGREIGATAGRMLKRVTLELGGKSANVILPDANLKAALGGAF